MKKMKKLVMLLLCVLMVHVELVFPQASASTAELRGQITDESGAAVAGAQITITDVNKGTTRTVNSDEDGNYVLLSLLPSVYNLKVEASGFAPKNLTDIKLDVGQAANIPVQLSVGGVQAEVNVVAGNEAAIEPERTQQSSVISEVLIDNLPINRRNYLDFALLTPGVTDSDNINDSSDFRVAQTPQSGLSFGGNNGRGNSIMVDGASADTNSGAARTVVSQEGVQEFQVNRNSYNAEFGGASGGIVNIVSKTGSNDIHGSIFGYFRDEKFDARNAFDFNPDGQSPFDRQQFGGSLGAPIARDKTFFFTAFERLQEDRTTFVNLLNDPSIFTTTARQEEFLGLLGGSGSPALIGLGNALRANLVTTSANFPGTIALFNDASGQFPFEENSTIFSARIDHTFGQSDSAYFRLNLADAFFENNAAGALTAVSRGRLIEGFTGGALFSETHFFSPVTINELKAQYSYVDNDVIPNDLVGPEINLAGFGNFGRDIFLPSEAIERRYEISDNMSLVRGAHSFKIGGQVQFVDNSNNSQTFFGGRFNFGSLPLIPFLVPAASQPAVNAFLAANGRADLAAVTINSVQAFNLGLAQIYQQGFGESGFNAWTRRYSLYGQDTWKVRPNFTLNIGARYFLEDWEFFGESDKNNIQPRIGFSWDPWNDGRTVIRAGYGIFTGQVDAQVVNVVNELAGTTDPSDINIVLSTANPALQAALGVPTSFTIFRTLAAQGVIGNRTITAGDLAQFGIFPGPGRPLEVRFRREANYENPYTQQASLGIQRDLGAGFNMEVSYLFSRGAHLTRARDINPFKQTGPLSPITGQPTFNRFPNPVLGLTSDFLNPFRAQDNVYESSANSFYHAGTIQLVKRFSSRFSINTNYTLSKTIDEVTDFNSDFAAQNPLNVRLDRALSSFDQRHRFVFSGVFQSPFDGDSVADHILGGWLVSPIFIAGSGRPFNLLLGGIDANGDFRSSSDRPGTAGRNTGKGEPFYNVDVRLARRFFASENRYLELTFEGFNLFNHTNFTGINNEVGTTIPPTGPFNVRGIEGIAPTSPLGFTSAAPARQLQFGARFNF